MLDYSRGADTVVALLGLLYLLHLWESNKNKGKRAADIQAYRGETQRECIREKNKRTR